MKLHLKSFISGIIVATMGATAVFAAGGIKSAEFNANKIFFDGKAIDMRAQPMVSVVKEGETAISNYMPIRTVLEAMGYQVAWDGAAKTVHINTKTLTPAPAAPETALTVGALVGTWKSQEDGTTEIYQFDAAGNVHWLTAVKDLEAYSSGRYEIKDGMVVAEFDYLNDDGEILYMRGDDMVEVHMQTKINGNQITIVEGNATHTYSKQTAALDFSKYYDKTVSEKIVGFWTCTVDNATVKYHFDGKGNFASLADIKDGDKTILKGKYTVKSAEITLNYEDDASPDSFEVEFAKDGKSWTSKGFPEEKFVTDTGSTDWIK